MAIKMQNNLKKMYLWGYGEAPPITIASSVSGTVRTDSPLYAVYNLSNPATGTYKWNVGTRSNSNSINLYKSINNGTSEYISGMVDNGSVDIEIGEGVTSLSLFYSMGADSNTNISGGSVVLYPDTPVYGQQEVKKITMWANKLPAEYQAVEYIESHGEEYIDTGVPCIYGEQYNIDIDFQRLDEDEDPHYIFGYRGMLKRGLYLGFGYGDFVIYDGRPSGPIGRDYGGFTNYSFTPSTYAYNTRYDFNGDFDTGDINGEGNLTLFSWYSGISPISAKLYSCEVKVDGVQVRDFVPCYRKSDGEIGLYDLINNVFYTNNGSGAFTKGTDTRALVEKQIWPSGWQPSANTIAYWKFDGDADDYSGNGYDWSFQGIPIYTTLSSGTKVLDFDTTFFGTYNGVFYPWNQSNNNQKGPWTIVMWLGDIPSRSSTGADVGIIETDVNDSGVIYWTATQSTISNRIYFSGSGGISTSSSDMLNIPTMAPYTGMFSYIITEDGNYNQKIYINGQLVTQTITRNSSGGTGSIMRLGVDHNGTSSSERRYQGKMGEMIIENREWTAQEISSYVNLVKTQYGVS